MINEAKELILDKVKRSAFEIRFQAYKPIGIGLDVGYNDIVLLQPVGETNHHFVYGRVVALDSTSYTVAPQTSRRQFELDSVGSTIRLKVPKYDRRSLTLNPGIRREYGEHERQRSNDQWASYFDAGDVVAVDNVREAPWFNGTQATIVKYNRDLMRFEVRVDDGHVLAFLPHNIKKAPVLRLEMDPASEKTIQDRNTEIDRLNTYIDQIKLEHESKMPGQNKRKLVSFTPSMGEYIEMRCDNGITSNGRRTTWHVGIIKSINRSDNAETTYDIKMPDTFSLNTDGVVRGVKIVNIKARRKCGKRLAADISE